MPEAVIIDAVRPPIRALGGALSAARPYDLAAVVLEAIIERTGVDPLLIEEVYLSCANQAGEDNLNLVRILTPLLYEKNHRVPNEQRPYYGLANLCVGVGQGEATIVEWIGDDHATT